MKDYDDLLAQLASEIIAINAQRKELEAKLCRVYKRARKQGIAKLSLKNAVASYQIAEAGGVLPKGMKNDIADENLAAHIAIIDRAMTKLRTGEIEA